MRQTPQFTLQSRGRPDTGTLALIIQRDTDAPGARGTRTPSMSEGPGKIMVSSARHTRRPTEGTTVNLWNQAADTLSKAEHALEAATDGELSGEQLLRIAQVEALLAIGQELSKIHHEGINPEYSNEG
jgi:hypothetical protein